MKAKKDAEILKEKLDGKVFTSRDARIALGASSGYLKLLLHNLVKRGGLFRLSKGVYSFSEDVSQIGEAFRPSYHGLEEALSILGFSGQATVPVIITARKAREGVRAFNGANYLVRRIPSAFFFGFGAVRYGDGWLDVSDLEKTVLDFAHFGKTIPPESREAIRRKLDRKRLEGYLKRFPKRLRIAYKGGKLII